MFKLSLVVVVLALACQSLPRSDPPSSPAPGVLRLSEGESELRTAFNAQSDKPQLVVILSPT